MRAFLFPGQGSQAVGMGSALIDAHPVARHVWEEVDEALGQALTRLMRDGPADELTLTANAQPAIMANAIAAFRVARQEAGLTIGDAAFVAGHSLGEYTALCAADAFDLTTTARLLRLRGQAMQAAVPVGEGAMAALLGGTLDDARTLAEAAAGGEVCVVANDNDPTQVVISGHAAAVERAMAGAKEAGFRRAVALPVSAPFHSPLMAPAADAMAEALADQPPLAPAVPLIANVTAAATDDPATISRLLVEQVTGTVRWRESMAALADGGVTRAIEFGAKVLAPMVKRSAPDLAVHSVVTAEDLAAIG